jgi:hypothetical protein
MTVPFNSKLDGLGFYCVGDQEYGPPCGMVPNSLSAAGDNQTYLQILVGQVVLAGGGTILIPSGTYYIDGAITINPDSSSPSQTGPFALNIVGTGETVLVQVQAGADIFDVDINVPGTSPDLGAIVFQDLIFQYDYEQGATTGIAISLGNDASYHGSHNVHLMRLTFIDCPKAVLLANTLQASIFDCLITYTAAYAGTSSPVGITLGQLTGSNNALQTYIGDVRLESVTVNDGGPGGTGILIEHCDQLRVVNADVENFETGVAIIPLAGEPGQDEHVAHLYFSNLTVFSQTTDDTGATGQSLLVQAQGSAYVTQAIFEGCTFQAVIDEPTSYLGAGVLVDGSMSTGVLDQIRFVSCYSSNWPGIGMQVIGGQNIEVIGGAYSCNGSESAPLSAGLSILGTTENARIVGVTCNNSTIDADDGSVPTPVQQYGLHIDKLPTTSGPTNVTVVGCAFDSNLQNGVYIGAGTAIFIRNSNVINSGVAPMAFGSSLLGVTVTYCPGYNDRTITLASALPSGAFNGANFGYYGPVTFYISGSGITAINITNNPALPGVGTGLVQGAFRLDANQWGKVTSTGSVTFLMIGD